MSTTTAEEPTKTRGLTRLDEDQKATVEANMGLVYAIARSLKDCRLPEDDRIQAGTMGLMRAAQKFEPWRGVKFSTYASYWIKALIRRAEHFDAPIRTPYWTACKKAVTDSEARLIDQAEFVRSTASIEAFDADPTVARDDPSAPMREADGNASIHKALGALSERERRVLIARVWDGETLKQVGRREGVTPEAVRLRERTAIEKLRIALAPEFMEGD